MSNFHYVYIISQFSCFVKHYVQICLHFFLLIFFYLSFGACCVCCTFFLMQLKLSGIRIIRTPLHYCKQCPYRYILLSSLFIHKDRFIGIVHAHKCSYRIELKKFYSFLMGHIILINMTT